MKRSRTGLLLLLCLLVAGLGGGVWWQWRGRGITTVRASAEANAAAIPSAEAGPVAAAKPSNNSAPPPITMPKSANNNNNNDDNRTGPRFKRAYMLSLDKGALAMVDAQDIEGDFAPRRGKEEEWSSMLRFRLLSENREVLAEELLPAPDQVCRVLDPRSANGGAATLSNTGPVVFQVRMPRVRGARQLDVYRILQPGEPATETLLGSLPLPRS